LVAVKVGVAVLVGVLVAVKVGVAVNVGVLVAVNVGVAVKVGVLVAVKVGVDVRVGVGVGVEVNVGVLVAVKVGVGVGVGIQIVQSLATTQVVPHSYSPNSPPIGVSTVGKVPALRQWFLVAPGNRFGDCSVPSQFVTV
jgi:hypothetical protein